MEMAHAGRPNDRAENSGLCGLGCGKWRIPARSFIQNEMRRNIEHCCIWLLPTRHNGGMATKAKTPAPRKPMSTGHKAALARGRAESASVRHYLEALETSKPKRGRKRTPASIDRRLAAIDSQLAGADALTRLHLLQEQKDLLDERSRVDGVKDL